MSGTLLSIILSFGWAYSRSRPFKVTRSRKGQTENFGFGQRGRCFWVSFSSRTRKMTLKHFFKGPNRENFEKRKNVEIVGNSVKMTVFDLQNAKARAFFEISTWNYVHVYTWQASFTYIPVLWNFEKSQFFENNIYCSLFFKIFKIYKKIKIKIEIAVW